MKLTLARHRQQPLKRHVRNKNGKSYRVLEFKRNQVVEVKTKAEQEAVADDIGAALLEVPDEPEEKETED